MTTAEFATMVRNHDLTYTYSDNPGTFSRGEESLAAIRKAAHELGMDEARTIWNAEVDRKVKEGYRDQFYWKG